MSPTSDPIIAPRAAERDRSDDLLGRRFVRTGSGARRRSSRRGKSPGARFPRGEHDLRLHRQCPQRQPGPEPDLVRRLRQRSAHHLRGVVGIGQAMAHDAMSGIERATPGACIVGLRNSHHIGRIGHWAEQCAAAGLVSIHFVNVVSEPSVTPFGGTKARVGTNPFAVGIPRTHEPPVVVDFATSRLAREGPRGVQQRRIHSGGSLAGCKRAPDQRSFGHVRRACRRASSLRGA